MLPYDGNLTIFYNGSEPKGGKEEKWGDACIR